MSKTPAERILNYIRNKGISQTFISKKTGINKSTLSAKLNGKTKIVADDIELICGALEIQPAEFLSPRPPHQTMECDLLEKIS